MLRLVTDGTQWLVDWRDSDEASEIYELFGTYVIPTPYLVAMPRSEVVAELASIGTIVH